MSKLFDNKGKPIPENSPRSARYDIFTERVAAEGYEVKEHIDTLSRYLSADGTESVKYRSTLAAHRGDGSVALTCNIDRNWPPSSTWNAVQLETRTKEYALQEKDRKDKSFDFTAANMKKLKAMCDEKTEYQIQRDGVGRERSKITAKQFWDEDRKTIMQSFNTDTKQLGDLLREVLLKSGTRLG
jgi:hypothetical protein